MKVHLRWGSLIIGILVGISTWHLSQGNATYVQSWLTQSLLHTAWVRTQASGRQVRPWPWASTWPLARLFAPDLGTEQIILANASQTNFALGHLDTSVLPGDAGNSVLRAPPQTYLNFLRELREGDELVLESLYNGQWRYRISSINIVHKTNIQLLEPTVNRRLTVVSCYPCQGNFNNLRYVVVAEEVERIARSSIP